MILNFTIPMAPVAKGRVRMATRNSGRPIAFTPKETRNAEKVMADFAKEAMQGKPVLTKPLTVKIRFLLQKPKTVKRNYPTVKPDLDNYIKMLDAFNGIVWEDDSQIIEIIASKEYCNPTEIPSIEILVSSL